MAATLVVIFDFGGSDANPGTQQDTSALGPPNLRFKQADNATIDNNNPIPIPATPGTNRSRWKQIYLKCTVAPSLQIDNIRFYTDGTGFGAGIDVRVGLEFPTKNSGSNAGYEVADNNNDMIGEHSGLSNDASAFTYTTASPLSGPTISEASNIINAQNETSNYLVLQMEVDNTASPGNLADETFGFKYDEI